MAYTKLDRVRPSPAGVWDSTRSYTALELVNGPDGWKAYLARKAVPAGTALTDTVYWTEVLDVSDVIAAAEAATADANAAAAFAEPIRTKADGIKCTLEGTSVSASDASDDYLRGLRVFGKTTQNGTPSPNNPVELVSVGSGGSVNVIMKGAQLFDVNIGSNSVNVIASGEQIIAKTSNTNSYQSGYYEFSIPASMAGNYIYAKAESIKASGINDPCLSVRVFDDAGKELTATATRINLNENKLSGRTTLPEGCAKLRLIFYSTYTKTCSVGDTATYEKVMISYSDTDYEPYKSAQSLALSTPNGLPGIPVTSGGNYTDADGQMWICDEIDLDRGVYVQRMFEYIGFAEYPSVHVDGYKTYRCMVDSRAKPDNKSASRCTHTANNKFSTDAEDHFYTNGASGWVFLREDVEVDTSAIRIIAELATPIETALSAAEIAAYRALHSNYPNTTVYNDAGAHMAVSYNADTKTYIDNKFAALSAAIV